MNSKKLRSEDVDVLFKAISSLQNVEECYKFFEDVCTVKEMIEMAQRLKAARMLTAGSNYLEVCANTGMSSATISRVNKCLVYGSGGYRTVLARLDDGQGKE